MNKMTMSLNNFKITFRTILREKVYAIINVLGLALGITCSIVIYLVVSSLTGIDDYHTKRDRIYRVVTESINNGRKTYNSGVPTPLIKAFEVDFPEMEIVAPVDYVLSGRIIINKEADSGSNIFEEREGIAFCDERLYQILDRKWIHGNKSTSLIGPGKVVLSESYAIKYFGKTNIVGKRLILEGSGDLMITGVMEDYPRNKTDFPFEILVSYATKSLEYERFGSWSSTSSDFQCYVLLHKGENIDMVAQKLPAFADKYYGEDRTSDMHNSFQPLSDIHYNQHFSNYSYRSISRESIWVMVILGVFLIITACINFVNLTTAQASNRIKEIGIRKILGSSRAQLIISLLVETSLITVVSLLVALGLAELSLIKVNQFLDLQLSLDLTGGWEIWLFLFATGLLVSLMAGLYPAIIFSGYQPINAIKGKIVPDWGKGFMMRRGLVVFQFIISQVLIIGTIIATSQLQYFKNTPVGFEKEGIINVDIPTANVGSRNALFGKLTQISSVDAVSFSSGPPAWGGVSTTNVYYHFEERQEELFAQVKICDENYINVYGLNLLFGEGLVASDTMNRAVINESFARRMGYMDVSKAVGIIVSIWGKDVPVVGVVGDFHTMSFKRKIEPVILYNESQRYEIAAIRIRTGNLSASLTSLERVFEQVYPGYAFNYNFMDEKFAEFFAGEEKMSNMLLAFTGIAIFIGCLGLYGLVSYMISRKTKEIGIRKVLGASVFSIILLFSKEFTLLVIIAFVVSGPIAYLGMSNWLQKFAYHIELVPLMFITGIALSALIAFTTIAYQSINASLANPVDALKDE